MRSGAPEEWQKSLKIPKGIIRTLKSTKDGHYNGQKFEDTKGVITIRKWKRDRQYNGQK